jgi:hypothetical protein
MDGSIMSIFHPRELFHPYFGLVKSEATKILLKGAIHHLGLAFGLWVIIGTENETQ